MTWPNNCTAHFLKLWDFRGLTYQSQLFYIKRSAFQSKLFKNLRGHNFVYTPLKICKIEIRMPHWCWACWIRNLDFQNTKRENGFFYFLLHLNMPIFIAVMCVIYVFLYPSGLLSIKRKLPVIVCNSFKPFFFSCYVLHLNEARAVIPTMLQSPKFIISVPKIVWRSEDNQ